MASTLPTKSRKSFFVQIPAETLAAIKAHAEKLGVPEWLAVTQKCTPDVFRRIRKGAK